MIMHQIVIFLMMFSPFGLRVDACFCRRTNFTSLGHITSFIFEIRRTSARSKRHVKRRSHPKNKIMIGIGVREAVGKINLKRD
jgi:hypothetical protein